MRYFISLNQFLNENYGSPKRALIYQKLLQRGINVSPDIDKLVADFLIQRLIRQDLSKIKDRIIANFCRMLIQDYLDVLGMDAEDDEENHDQIDQINFLNGEEPKFDYTPNSVIEGIKDLYLNQHGGYYDQTTNILDFLNSPLRNPNEGIAWDSISWIQLNNRAEEFHQEIGNKAKGKIISQNFGGPIIHKISDVLIWVDLLTNNSKEEADIMGHCGNDSRATTLYSLRKITKNNEQYIIEPLITAAIKFAEYGDEISGVVLQMKGKANSKPKEEYHPYIVELLIHSKINCINTHYGYKPELNFHLSDLNEELTCKLLKSNPVSYDKMYSDAKDILDSELEKLLQHQCYIDYITSLPEDSLHKIIGKKMDNVLIVYYINRAQNVKGESLPNNLHIIKYIVDDMEEPKDVYDHNTGDDTEEYKTWFKNIRNLKLKEWADSLGVSLFSY